MINLTDKKVKLVYYDLEGELAIESVWAMQEGRYYRIKNIPFFAPNIAYDDLISVEVEEGELFFDDKIQESGNSTIHIIIFQISRLNEVISQFESLNCGWEGSHLSKYISVNVPKEVDYKKVREYLQYGRKTKIFDYQESCLSEKHR